jgi:tripartite-type tricarboxylate transporter receptor subunit TctC
MTLKLSRRAAIIATSCIPFASPISVMAAEDYPSKPITWIVAYPAGGGSDFLARTVAARLGRELGQTVIIDNRPGAATIIGAQAASRAPADGYTIFTADNGSLVFNPALYAKLPYKPTDFAPIGLMARFPLLLVTNKSSGYGSAKAIVDAAKAKPGALNYGSPGVGGPHHLAMELLKSRAGFEAEHVAYKGAAPAVQDLIGGKIPLMMLDTATALPHLKTGAVRAVAVAASKRLPQFPEVSTLKEIGYDVEVHAWQGLVIPAATPQSFRDKLTLALQKTLADPEVIKSLTNFGLEVTPGDGKQMASYADAETKLWHPLIRQLGLKMEN